MEFQVEIDDSRLDVAVRAAVSAGDKAASIKHSAAQERKSNGSIVTEADREAEKIVRQNLNEFYSYPILGEEEGGDVDMADTYWVVDPIDGTRNFANQQPLYGTAVALVEDNEPVVGVFYMPDLEYLFYAVEGDGAYRNGKKFR